MDPAPEDTPQELPDQPEQPPEVHHEDPELARDSLLDSLAMIETWAAVDAAGTPEARRQAAQSMSVLVRNLGNSYAVALTMAKVLSVLREEFMACHEPCCADAAGQRFREWFLARSD